LLRSAFIVLLDQVSKGYITRHYGDSSSRACCPFSLSRACIVGAAFSFLASARRAAVGVHRTGGAVSIAIIVWFVAAAARRQLSAARGGPWCSGRASAT